jgi:hypothetical protein
MKFCTIDYGGEVTNCVKNGWNRLLGMATHIYKLLPIFFIYHTLPSFLIWSYIPDYWADFTHDGTNDAAWSMEVLSGGRVTTKFHLDV